MKGRQPVGRQFFAFVLAPLALAPVVLAPVVLASLLLFSGCSKNEYISSSSTSSSSVSSSPTAVSSEVSSTLSVVSQVSSAGSSSEKPVSSKAISLAVPSKSVLYAQAAPVGATPGAVPVSAKVSPSYLDDAVFIGDSVSLKLKLYTAKIRQSNAGFFGKAQFLVQGSMGSGNALQPVSAASIHPSYNGQKMLIEDSVAAMGAKKVYIMLGMNDIALYGIEGSVTNMGTLIGRIKAKSPNAIILVQSATPMIMTMQRKDLNNANMYTYDQKLAALCVRNGWNFIDVAEVMRDKNGALPANYCSDPEILGMHFTDTACQVWVDYLLTHTVH